MAFVQLLSAVSSANGAPVDTRAVVTITTVAGANLVDGERFTLGDGSRVQIFEFDKDGKGVDYSPGSSNLAGPLNPILIDVSGTPTADQVRDKCIAAVNASGLPVLATSGGAATVTITASVAGTAIGFKENVANATFAIASTTSPVFSGVYPGEDREDLDTFDAWTTGAVSAVSITLAMWCYSYRSGLWLVMQSGPVTPLVPASGNNAGRSELLPAGIANRDRIYLQVSGTFASGAVSACMYSKGQRRAAT